MVTVAIAALLVTAGPLEAPAATDPPLMRATPYELDLFTHGAATLSALASISVYVAFIEPGIPGGLACEPPVGHSRCDPAVLNELDRTVVGNNSLAWRKVSDAGMYGAVALSAAAAGLDAWLAESDAPGSDFFTDALVLAEATALAMVITDAIKLTVRRPRPNHYTVGAPVKAFRQQLSFPSGHTSTAAAVTTAYSVTFALRHPESPWRFAVFGGAAAISVVTGLARVAGGRHFYTDVLAGLLIGAGAGILIPWWHVREGTGEGGSVVISPQVGAAGVGLGLSGSF